MNKPTVVILGAGENSRFAPLNTKTHKGFLNIAGKSIISRALENLKKNGFENIVIVVSPKDNAYDFGFPATTIIQEKSTGMGDAILLAKKYLQNNFIVASPYYANIGEIAEQLWQKKLKSGASCVYSGTKTNVIGLYGILQTDPNNPKKVIGVEEKPTTNTAESVIKIDSIYLFDQGFINELETTKKDEYSLEDAIKIYSKKTEAAWIENTGEIQSLKYPWHIFNLFSQVMATQKSFTAQSAKIADTAIFDESHGPISIDENATIGDFVKLVGPCYIGRNCLVGDYSFVRGSSLEEGATVGANTEVVRSILFEKSSIHFGYLADSILGHKTKVGAGLITANKRLDRKNIRIEVKNKLIDTGTNTLGIITGEDVNIGIRVNTMPGITIGASAKIHPGATITRNVPAGEIVKK